MRSSSSRWPALCLGSLATALWFLAPFGNALAQLPPERAIGFFEERVRADPEDFIAWNRLGDLALAHYRDTGALRWFRRAMEAATASLKIVAPELNPAGLFLQARVDLSGHRFAEARDRARQLRVAQPANSNALALLADAMLELGDLAAAAQMINELAELEPQSLVAESRLARLALQLGCREKAREHFLRALAAAREMSPPQQSTIAWCLLQLGELDFRSGRWDEAELSYQAALALIPNWWSALDHLAELRAAQGRDPEAIEHFTAAATATDRPEIWQALGDCHAFKQRSVDATRAHDRALAGYQSSIDRGEVLYVHHLAGFYTDSREDPDLAVKWARRDLELRQSAGAWDALAWALHKRGDHAAALDAAKKALANGSADTHLIYHAAMIHISAGEVAQGGLLLKRCAEINPHFNAFHVHR